MRAERKSVLHRAEIFTGSTCSTHAIKKYFIQRKKNNSETPHWYNNEPSFQDTGSDAPSAISEDVMNLFFVSESWYLNDSSSDLPGDYPSLLSGKVGYIVEIE